MTDDEPMSVTVGVDMKVNLGNYESASASLFLSKVPVGASEKDIEDALDTAKVTFNLMKERLYEQATQLRKGR